MSTTIWAYRPKPSLYELNVRKSSIKNHVTLFRVRSSRQPDQTQLGFIKLNKSPTWRLVQSPTSTAIFQKQSLIPATHPLVLKLEDQLKLHTASTSQ